MVEAGSPRYLTWEDVTAQLTWKDLQAWTGANTVSRGKDYQKDGLVHDLGITSSGALTATVRDTLNNDTLVDVEDGSLTSRCTCMFMIGCKHAVATIIEFLKIIKQGAIASVATDDDYRLSLLMKYLTLVSIIPIESQGNENLRSWCIAYGKI